jgi:hypothetical protein
VLERIAQKEGDAEQQNDQAGVLQPAAADALLEIRALSPQSRRA